MPHNITLILTLTGGLGTALVLGFVTHKLRLSPIVGYLLAGVVVGPFSPGFVADSHIAEQLAELGVVLLLFGVGLHFSLKELIEVRRIAVPGAIVQIVVAAALGVAATRVLGWDWGPGLVYGIAISVASTVVLLRVLSDYNALHTRSGHVAVGWLLVEDLFTVLVLVLLPILAGVSDPTKDSSTGGVLLSIGLAVLKVGALIAFTLIVGQRVIPKILTWVAKTRSRELFTLTVLVIALGIAVGSATLFGASMALGAFLAGMVVGQSEFSVRAASEALPMRDAFAVLFFVSMGMLFDPAQLTANAPLTMLTLGVILIGKPLAALSVVLLLRGPTVMAATVAIALSQIGEFSFILAALARQLDLLPETAIQSLVAASIISITLNPLLFRYVEPFSRWFGTRFKHAKQEEEARELEEGGHPIVVGYGPVGRTLVHLLVENGLSPTVIELNHESLAGVRALGLRAVNGDASQAEVLESAGIRTAGSLVYAASGSPEAAVRMAKELNPRVLVLTRTTYVAEVPKLRGAGGDVVVAAEGEVALAMTERLLEQLGATSEQLDRARDKVRAELK